MELTDLTRRKARRSGDNGGSCVEVAALTGATWCKTRHSHDNDCVELASLDGSTAVRDSKNPGGAVLAFTPQEWNTFVADVRTGAFDLR